MSDWETLYQAAILETDWAKIEEHIQAADSAIAPDSTTFPSTAVAPQKKINGY